MRGFAHRLGRGKPISSSRTVPCSADRTGALRCAAHSFPMRSRRSASTALCAFCTRSKRSRIASVTATVRLSLVNFDSSWANFCASSFLMFIAMQWACLQQALNGLGNVVVIDQPDDGPDLLAVAAEEHAGGKAQDPAKFFRDGVAAEQDRIAHRFFLSAHVE